MSMVKCSECGKRVSSAARTCPSCGVSPVVAAKDYTVLKNVATVIVITAVIVKCMSSVQNPETSSAAFSQTDAARGACLLFIKRQLHDPGSAEFQDATVTAREGDIWTVQRAVRAKNALGAYQLQNFECRIRQRDDNFELVSINPK